MTFAVKPVLTGRLVVLRPFAADDLAAMREISLEVYSFNPRARRVYEKAGFRAEGVLRESLRYGEEWIDATVMSILAREWSEHRGHPEAAV